MQGWAFYGYKRALCAIGHNSLTFVLKGGPGVWPSVALPSLLFPSFSVLYSLSLFWSGWLALLQHCAPILLIWLQQSLGHFPDLLSLAREGLCPRLALSPHLLCYSSAEVTIAWVNFKPSCSGAKTSHPATDYIICVTDVLLLSGAWKDLETWPKWQSLQDQWLYRGLRLKAFSL